jgi:hypothetical protein
MYTIPTNWLKRKGFKKIALATDPYQTNNLHGYLKKNAYDISLLPIQYDTVSIMNLLEPKIVATLCTSRLCILFKLSKSVNLFLKGQEEQWGKTLLSKLL